MKNKINDFVITRINRDLRFNLYSLRKLNSKLEIINKKLGDYKKETKILFKNEQKIEKSKIILDNIDKIKLLTKKSKKCISVNKNSQSKKKQKQLKLLRKLKNIKDKKIKKYRKSKITKDNLKIFIKINKNKRNIDTLEHPFLGGQFKANWDFLVKKIKKGNISDKKVKFLSSFDKVAETQKLSVKTASDKLSKKELKKIQKKIKINSAYKNIKKPSLYDEVMYQINNTPIRKTQSQMKKDNENIHIKAQIDNNDEQDYYYKKAIKPKNRLQGLIDILERGNSINSKMVPIIISDSHKDINTDPDKEFQHNDSSIKKVIKKKLLFDTEESNEEKIITPIIITDTSTRIGKNLSFKKSTSFKKSGNSLFDNSTNSFGNKKYFSINIPYIYKKNEKKIIILRINIRLFGKAISKSKSLTDLTLYSGPIARETRLVIYDPLRASRYHFFRHNTIYAMDDFFIRELNHAQNPINSFAGNLWQPQVLSPSMLGLNIPLTNNNFLVLNPGPGPVSPQYRTGIPENLQIHEISLNFHLTDLNLENAHFILELSNIFNISNINHNTINLLISKIARRLQQLPYNERHPHVRERLLRIYNFLLKIKNNENYENYMLTLIAYIKHNEFVPNISQFIENDQNKRQQELTNSHHHYNLTISTNERQTSIGLNFQFPEILLPTITLDLTDSENTVITYEIENNFNQILFNLSVSDFSSANGLLLLIRSAGLDPLDSQVIRKLIEVLGQHSDFNGKDKLLLFLSCLTDRDKKYLMDLMDLIYRGDWTKFESLLQNLPEDKHIILVNRIQSIRKQILAPINSLNSVRVSELSEMYWREDDTSAHCLISYLNSETFIRYLYSKFHLSAENKEIFRHPLILKLNKEKYTIFLGMITTKNLEQRNQLGMLYGAEVSSRSIMIQRVFLLTKDDFEFFFNLAKRISQSYLNINRADLYSPSLEEDEVTLFRNLTLNELISITQPENLSYYYAYHNQNMFNDKCEILCANIFNIAFQGASRDLQKQILFKLNKVLKDPNFKEQLNGKYTNKYIGNITLFEDHIWEQLSLMDNADYLAENEQYASFNTPEAQILIDNNYNYILKLLDNALLNGNYKECFDQLLLYSFEKNWKFDKYVINEKDSPEIKELKEAYANYITKRAERLEEVYNIFYDTNDGRVLVWAKILENKEAKENILSILNYLNKDLEDAQNRIIKKYQKLNLEKNEIESKIKNIILNLPIYKSDIKKIQIVDKIADEKQIYNEIDKMFSQFPELQNVLPPFLAYCMLLNKEYTENATDIEKQYYNTASAQIELMKIFIKKGIKTMPKDDKLRAYYILNYLDKWTKKLGFIPIIFENENENENENDINVEYKINELE